VRELAKLANGQCFEFNLSQFTKVEDLFAAFRFICNPLFEDRLRIAFFDEFDAKLAGQPLGWLACFLGPMQDGVFMDQGLPHAFGNCVFIFGGGTACRREEFARVHAQYFVGAKGPDFMSRLEGKQLDLSGINGNDKQLRRAILVHGLLNDEKKKDIPRPLLRKLLNAGRYRHGTRSLKTVLRVLVRRSWKVPKSSDILHHVDGGPLERVRIALSAGGAASKSRGVHQVLATALLERHARLVYGGDPLGYAEKKKDQEAWVDNYISGIRRALTQRPASLLDDQGQPVTNFLATGVPDPGWKAGKTADVDYVRLNTVTKGELRQLGIKRLERPADVKPELWLGNQQGWALSLFRMRLRLIREADAIVAMTGKEFGSSGRFPGVAEEVMLAVAFSKPLYLVGGFGGAAEAVGSIMGLPKIWHGMPRCLTEDGHLEWNKKQKMREFLEWMGRSGNEFRLPFRSGLPENYGTLCSFLGEGGPDGPRWTDNGLTKHENQELFCSKDEMEITELICRGLERVDWERGNG